MDCWRPLHQLKLTAFNRPRSENFRNLKLPRSEKFSSCLYFILPHSENFGIYGQKASQIDNILFCYAAKTFGIYQQKQLKLAAFGFTTQRKFLEFAIKINSNGLYFVLPRSVQIWKLPPLSSLQ
jgi:hypothetical protein